MQKNSTGRKRLLVTIATMALAAAATSWAPSASAKTEPSPAPGKLLTVPSKDQVKGRYIVSMSDKAASVSTTSAQKLAGKYGGQAHRAYNHALRGFSAKMSEAEAAKLAADPQVKYVAPVQIGHSSETQTNPTWGLDRIDQKTKSLDGKYTYNTTASNVTAYIVDSGIRMSHQDFGGRAKSGYDFVDNDSNASDCLGHGTHVAGTVGGTKYGVAKGAKLVSVRILDCNDSSSTELALNGIEWVTEHAAKPAVANFSLQFGNSDTVVENAIKESIASGVTWSLSGNNFNSDACQSSPAKVPEAITVGNTTKDDARRSDSNYGSCLDIWAPGTDIVSTSHQSDTGTRTMSGTSMSAPHVAGAAALYLADHPSATPKQTRDALVAQATTVTIGDAKPGSPNKLLNTNSGGTEPEPTTCPAASSSSPVTIADNSAAVTSPVTIADCAGQASATTQVTVDITHTYRGDVVLDLVAPDGSTYRLKNSSDNDSADNIRATYTVNASAEARNGTWKLRAQDVSANDSGRINSWKLTV
ncbi:S8 family peptidase [Streptomyces zagrosensis]|uniref:Subtilisin family serine protease n=1 Tax=Streptomyces zagrosensis TaxID=1042984 RepID=A0A7W9Q6A8_9ACTN|nr:S8 family peptidase [Streptomyces zagrosensis]MBB5934296.1 subtilisin family serine protease [Streptomyces zagrosensis]